MSGAPASRGGAVATAVSADEFKAAFRGHPGGVSLITAVGADGPVALTATSVTSVSADPPMLVFSVSTISSSHAALTSCDTVVVHLLAAEHQRLAALGATSGVDRFADTALWDALPTGEPVFHGPRWLRARVLERIPAGTATVLVAEVVETALRANDGHGLVYVDRTWHHIGEHSMAPVGD